MLSFFNSFCSFFYSFCDIQLSSIVFFGAHKETKYLYIFYSKQKENVRYRYNKKMFEKLYGQFGV